MSQLAAKLHANVPSRRPLLLHGLGADPELHGDVAAMIDGVSNAAVEVRSAVVRYAIRHASNAHARRAMRKVLTSSVFAALALRDQLDVLSYLVGPEVEAHRNFVEKRWRRRRNELCASFDRDPRFFDAPTQSIAFVRCPGIDEYESVILGSHHPKSALSYAQEPVLNARGETAPGNHIVLCPDPLFAGERFAARDAYRTLKISRREELKLIEWIESTFAIYTPGREQEPRLVSRFRPLTCRRFAAQIQDMLSVITV